ncbi:MAG: serine/threonine-protein kinase [Planctomycetia bacterium]|nr:serine/threonine-protein kinase [Planctomycetia bacterium]
MSAAQEDHSKDNNAITLETGNTMSWVREKNFFPLMSQCEFPIMASMAETVEVGVEPGAASQTISGAASSFLERSSYSLMSYDTELPKIGGLYQFRESVGTGGFSCIYKAYDVVLQRDVAIKTLSEEYCSKYVSRNAFIAEANVTASLDHPNIIPIHGLYTDENNQLHLVMKLIEGKNLREILTQKIKDYESKSRREIVREERANLINRLEIFLKICDAVAYAHNKKILHRDIKPENIMVSSYNEVYVMDWGISEAREVRSQQKKKTVLGTLQYLAPEIIANAPYDSRSDIYSLGVLLFYLVYLYRPFPEQCSSKEICKVKNSLKPLITTHTFGVNVPHELGNIVRKAMALSPKDRYQTVQALADDVHRVLRGDSLYGSMFGRVLKFFGVPVSPDLAGHASPGQQ